MSIILKIDWALDSPNRESAPWNLVELDFASLESAVAMMETGRMIIGVALYTRKSALDDSWIVTGEDVCAFRGDAVVKAVLARGEYLRDPELRC